MNDLGRGLDYFMEGFRIIRQPGMRRYVWIPIVINTLMFVWVMRWAWQAFDEAMGGLMAYIPGWLEFVSWLLWGVFALLLVLVIVYAYVFLATLIGAPFYALLAEKVEVRLRGGPRQEAGGWHMWLMLVPRTLWRELIKLMYYLPRALALFVLGFIPVVQMVSTVLWWLLSSWMMALEFFDYTADNNQQPFSAVKKFARERRGLALGFGGSVWVATLVPGLNLFAIPAAVAGGVACWVREGGALLPLAQEAESSGSDPARPQTPRQPESDAARVVQRQR
ncbi:MAG: sulfate transporter CysZ [Gammaproteobacteria bacterium]|nr:MAG: sulfate transporter CysZ [Gammaproteobacteria bacterium]